MVSDTKYVYDFAEGNRDLKDLLGGKGANLAEMTNLGLPVPPGFIITTEACREYLAKGSAPAELSQQVSEHLALLEKTMGKVLGDPGDPLLVSVRSGAKFSMPGMMDTVLNIGLNDESVQGLAKQSDNPRFAWDSYRRLVQMFGRTVLGVDGELFEHAMDEAKKAKGTLNDLDLDEDDFRGLVATFQKIVRDATGRDFPQNPREQMDLAVSAVFDSWNGDRAKLYRRQERIPADLGTAVNIVTMVFGNIGMTSGTGVAFTRDPGSGDQGVYGDYLQNAQGEDVVAGIRNTIPLADLEQLDKVSYDQLMTIMATLEHHYLDLCDIEFTVERGKLWMLQTRVGKRTAGAAFRIATQLIDEGLIDLDEALLRVTGAQLAMLMFPRFDDDAVKKQIGKGVNASPGAAVGKVVFDSDTAVEWAARGEQVLLVRRETTPDDLHGMIAANGILTSRGGKTSHAAVVARGMGKTCVSGAEELEVDLRARTFSAPGGVIVREGDVVSIDGTSGKVYLGEVPVVDSPVVQYFEGTIAADADELVAAVHRLVTHADGARRLGVRANSDTPEDSERARRFGAAGIGLCRTEHMFLGDRRQLVEDLILATDESGRDAALAALLPLQREDFIGILTAMDGLPVTVRLIDPPLPRVPALAGGACRQGGRRRSAGQRPGPRQDLARRCPSPSRAEPDAGPSRCASRAGDPGSVQDAGPRHRRGCCRVPQARPGPAPGDHGSVGRSRAGARSRPRRVAADSGRRRRGGRSRCAGSDRHDDRGPARRHDRRPDRRGRRVLQLRHQRPHSDGLGLLARRRRGSVLLPVPRARHLRRLSVRVTGS